MPLFDTKNKDIWPVPNTKQLNLTNFGRNLLKACEAINKPLQGPVDLEEFMKKSAAFPIPFGTDTCRVMSQPKERYSIIEKQIASAYPVIHERVLGLYLNFLEHKSKHGSPIEKKTFSNMSLVEFVQRLLTKRCVCFFGHADFYKLINGQQGFGGFQAVGTPNEISPLTLENVLSYDEMKLSAFLSVSTHTEFLNDGNRNNSGCIELDKSKIEESGVIVGLIGPRFQVANVMDCQDILVTKEQNTKQKGYSHEDKKHDTKERDYRRVWNDFYEEKSFLYDNVKKCGSPRFFEYRQFRDTKKRIFFDNCVIRKRYAISIDTLLLEAESRAAAIGKQAYVHAVGIGLGVWKVVKHQEELFFETFAQRLKALLPHLNHISVVDFSWFKLSGWRDIQNGNIIPSNSHPNGGIKIIVSRRSPADKLSEEFKDMLVVASFAWDSNALPGNEFWEKCLSNSSDSSTASSTLITELMNAHINTEFVNGPNLHIATEDHGVIHIQDYCKNVLKLF